MFFALVSNEYVLPAAGVSLTGLKTGLGDGAHTLHVFRQYISMSAGVVSQWPSAAHSSHLM